MATTGFFFAQKNMIAEEHQDIRYCEQQYIKSASPSRCYEAIAQKALAANSVRGVARNLGLELVEANQRIPELEKNLQRIKNSFAEVQRVSVNDQNFRNAISFTGVFNNLEKLDNDYSVIAKGLTAVEEIQKANTSLNEAADLLKKKYSAIDPKFEVEVDRVVSRLSQGDQQMIGRFMGRQAGPMEEARQQLEKGNKLVAVFNNNFEGEQEKIRKFAEANGMAGFEFELEKLLRGPEEAEKHLNYLVFSKDFSYALNNTLKSQGKWVYGYSSQHSPINIYVDYRRTEGSSILDFLRGKYFKVTKVDKFETATGETGYSLFFEFIPLVTSSL